MKIKLLKLKNAEDVLNKLINIDLPIKTSYKLMKLLEFVSNELKQTEALRIKLIKKYGEEEGHNFVVKNENMTKFTEEYAPLMDQEVDFNFDPIDISEFGDIKLNALDIAKISDWLLVVKWEPKF